MMLVSNIQTLLNSSLKDEEWRIRLVVGGDKLEYISDSGSPTTDLIGTKLLLNIFIPDAHNGARFASMDLKDMFLHMEMWKSEYMKAPYKCFPTDIKIRYNLDKIIHNDYVYIKTQKGMYGLKKAEVLAYTQVSTPS